MLLDGSGGIGMQWCIGKGRRKAMRKVILGAALVAVFVHLALLALLFEIAVFAP